VNQLGASRVVLCPTEISATVFRTRERSSEVKGAAGGQTE
jgi:hypothetical protein